MKKILLICVLLFIFLCSCSDKGTADKEAPNDNASTEKQDAAVSDDGTQAGADIVQTEPPLQEEEADDATKTEISRTTGLPCTPEQYSVRPICVMYNNNKVSYPQNEISKADIVYECDAEGGLTRLMALFSDWHDLGELGSVRSSRDYFVSLSESHGAIYVHAGGSPTAYEKLKSSDADNLDGVNMYNLPKNTFYRNSDRIKNSGYEHSMMTTGEKILKAAEKLGYSTSYSDGFDVPYVFNAEPIALNASPVSTVSLKYSGYITVRFEYDTEKKEYLKYSFNSPHVDGTNGEQLSFTNVIVLFVSEKVVDSEGRLDVDLTTGGTGYYITGGEYIDINWTRKSDDSPFVLTANGKELKLNPGKTHISLFNKNIKNNVTIK